MIENLKVITLEDMNEIKKQFKYLEKVSIDSENTKYFPSMEFLVNKTKNKEVLIKSLAFLVWVHQNTINNDKYEEYTYLDNVLNEFANRFDFDNIDDFLENIKNKKFRYSVNQYNKKKGA